VAYAEEGMEEGLLPHCKTECLTR